MLEVIRGKDKTVALRGAIDGSEDFEALLAGLAPGTSIDCLEILQINSTGIKAWMRFFNDPAKASLGLEFVRFSPPLVGQLNMIRNFAGVVTVHSVAVPFRCPTCDLSFSHVYPVSALSRSGSHQLHADCTRCKGPTLFDDMPEEYFEFLAR